MTTASVQKKDSHSDVANQEWPEPDLSQLAFGSEIASSTSYRVAKNPARATHAAENQRSTSTPQVKPPFSMATGAFDLPDLPALRLPVFLADAGFGSSGPLHAVLPDLATDSPSLLPDLFQQDFAPDILEGLDDIADVLPADLDAFSASPDDLDLLAMSLEDRLESGSYLDSSSDVIPLNTVHDVHRMSASFQHSAPKTPATEPNLPTHPVLPDVPIQDLKHFLTGVAHEDADFHPMSSAFGALPVSPPMPVSHGQSGGFVKYDPEFARTLLASASAMEHSMGAPWDPSLFSRTAPKMPNLSVPVTPTPAEVPDPSQLTNQPDPTEEELALEGGTPIHLPLPNLEAPEPEALIARIDPSLAIHLSEMVAAVPAPLDVQLRPDAAFKSDPDGNEEMKLDSGAFAKTSPGRTSEAPTSTSRSANETASRETALRTMAREAVARQTVTVAAAAVPATAAANNQAHRAPFGSLRRFLSGGLVAAAALTAVSFTFESTDVMEFVSTALFGEAPHSSTPKNRIRPKSSNTAMAATTLDVTHAGVPVEAAQQLESAIHDALNHNKDITPVVAGASTVRSGASTEPKAGSITKSDVEPALKSGSKGNKLAAAKQSSTSDETASPQKAGGLTNGPGDAPAKSSPKETTVASLPKDNTETSASSESNPLSARNRKAHKLRLYVEEGKHYLNNSDYAIATDYLEKALETARALGDQKTAEWLDIQIGKCYMVRGELIMKDVIVTPNDCKLAGDYFEAASRHGQSNSRNEFNIRSAQRCTNRRPPGEK